MDICHIIPVVCGLLKGKYELIMQKCPADRGHNLCLMVDVKIEITFLKQAVQNLLFHPRIQAYIPIIVQIHKF